MASSSLEVGVSRPSSRPSSGIASPPARSRSRTQSLSSDRPSTIGQHSLMSPPPSVSPEAAFIARSAASQIISNDHDGHADTWYDEHGIELSGESATVSDAALHLVNNFLDQLLFNFLSLAGSTTLTALRPAVSEVLKPKLAKDAINQADEELREYLGGGDDEELLQGPTAAPKDWDLELVWKRTRLRCMVYSSLGDMEEEDEDYHMQEESLELGDETLGDTVSPAVSIFLTSILEFMGEQALIVAGQAAYHRMRVKHEKEVKDGRRTPGSASDPITVEDVDMERVALDRTLGRLWRAWKKRIRSPGSGSLDHSRRPRSRESNQAPQLGHYRQISMDPESSIPRAVEERPDEHGEQEVAGGPAQGEEAAQPTEASTGPAAIPLPLSENDVAEIEVPGLVSYSDDEEDDDGFDAEPHAARPKSMMIFPRPRKAELPTPTASQPDSPICLPRKRSNSLPTPAASPYKPAADRELLVPATSAVTDEAEEHEATATPAEDLARDEESTTNEHQPAPKRPSGVVSSIKVMEPDPASDSEAELGDHDDGDDTIEFTEEPQILTSSRISISGRSSSPTSSDRGRSSMPLSPLHLVRSGSMHSLRLVEVTSPRSPTVRLHGSSVYEPEPGAQSRSLNPSRTSSVTTPPIEEEGRRSDDGSRSLKTTAAESISENENTEEPVAVVSASTRAPALTLVPVEEPKPEEAARRVDEPRAQPIFGSVVGHTSPSRSPVKAHTKVTVLGPPTSSGTFFFDDEKPQVPAKPASDSRSHAPTVPEKSSNRQSRVPPPAPPLPRASSIGNVSVERPAADRRESPELLPPQDQQHGRQVHTSGSSTSSGNSKMKTMRGSQESSRTRLEDVARNFEELIQSDQTIQYTLTPESMRDMDSKSLSDGSPLMPTKSRKSEDTRHANGSRSRSSSVAKPVERTRSVSISRAAGLSSHPVEPSQSSNKLSGPVPRAPPVSMQNRLRGSGPQARDARVPRESLADFADFIRATGPPEEPRAAPAPGRKPPSVARSASGPLPSLTRKASVDSGRPSNATSIRQRLQARGAAVDSKDDNSDLIDFIRRGPPDAAGNPRIPRTVAPFRTTMDSDQLASAVGGKAVDATIPDLRYSQASTNVTDVSMPSVQSSISSQTALLGRNKPLPNHVPSQSDEDNMMPKRKTRRVPDPYAIDLSDEEDDDLFDELPKRRPPPKEESLMDFLLNAPPPPETAPVPFHLPRAQAKPVPKKKASATSLIARFARHGSSGSNSFQSPTMATRPATSAPDSRAPSSRLGSSRGHGPIQPSLPRAPTAPAVPSGRERAGPAYSSSPNMSGPNMAAGGQPTQRVLMKKYQPREPAGGVARDVTDLADFLRNSEPPPSNNNVVPFALPSREEPSSFSRVFARRKKSSLA